MIRKFFRKLFPLKSTIEEFINDNEHFRIVKDNNRYFIEFSTSVDYKEIENLVFFLWNNGYDIAFHDIIYPTISDPGAYFDYSVKKAKLNGFWSMTFGNHGWTGGIYHIRIGTVSKQIFNLVNKGKIDRIQISNVIFFMHKEVMSKEKSEAMDIEIFKMHD